MNNCKHPFIVLAFILGALSGCGGPAGSPTTDTLDTVSANIEQGKAILLDVRESKEWDAGHLAVAKFLPLSEIKKLNDQSAPEALPDKSKIVYCYCVVGVRSVKAATLLSKLGYDARGLKPGIEELAENGFEKNSP